LKESTAPLIYYYSFLNLAKGCCELRQPQFHEHNECYRHGISWRPSPRYLVNLEKEEVSITTRGVWHVLWEFLTQASCSATNPTRIKIKELFLYCPEISSEVERTFMAEIRMLDLVDPDLLYDDGSMEAWIRFSVHREGLRFFRLPASSLIRQIETPRSSYTEVRSTKREIRTFEATTPAKVDPEESILGSLRGNILGLNVFSYLGHEKTIEYAIPVQTNLPIRMPQLMVLYTILFWLGSLVRYDPHSVSALMDSEYWILIDGFMSQSRLWLLEQFEWAIYQAETSLRFVR
jgi:hypothetical protein